MARDWNASFEVQVKSGRRWTIDSIHQSKSAALASAQALVGTNRHEAVKILRDEGEAKRVKVVFEQECAGPAEPVLTISPVEQAPACKKVEDFYRFEARRTAGQLLRQYFDHKRITAFELVHDYMHLRELGRMEDLCLQAAHRIAAIQARASGGDAMDRVDALYGALDQLTKRAEQAADPTSHLELLRDKGVGAARDDIASSVAAADRSFALGCALAAHLAEATDWPHKILLLVDLANNGAGEGALTPIDEICAEILDGAEAVKEVLGPQRDLAGALRALAQLSAGRYPASTPRARDSCLGKLNAVLAQHSLPLTQAVLLERVAHGIRSIQPLTREGEKSDRTAVIELLACVTGHGGLLGGRAMAEGLTRRIRMVMGDGGTDLTAEQGIDFVLGHLSSPATCSISAPAISSPRTKRSSSRRCSIPSRISSPSRTCCRHRAARTTSSRRSPSFTIASARVSCPRIRGS